MFSLSVVKTFYGVRAFLEGLITHLSRILEEVKEVTAVLNLLVVLETILKVA